MKTNNELDKRLLQMQESKNYSWGKVVSHLKRQFDFWALDELTRQGYEDFKMAYAPVLMNIHPNGVTNNELARKARVSKQAMSKVIKELTELSYVIAEIDNQDKRSSIIYLTTKGKKLVITFREKAAKLEKEYDKLMGKEVYAELKEKLIQIINYHDEKHGFASCF